MAEKYVNILRQAFVSMDSAQNILVIKTVAGMAMAVGAGTRDPGVDTGALFPGGHL